MSEFSNQERLSAFTRTRGLLAILATLVVISCVQNQPALESRLAELQKQFLSDPAVRADLEANRLVELPEDQSREEYSYIDRAVVPVVVAVGETEPVPSVEDAADDPAIWVHPTDPARSLLLGTDKKSGIAVYDLSGHQIQFLPAGLPNNIDLRQNVTIGSWTGDIAVSSDRADNGVTVFSVDESGVALLGSFPVDLEPYGICIGNVGSVADKTLVVFVTYKTGLAKGYQIDEINTGVRASELDTVAFSSQLEGCVHEDKTNTLYIGEEATGIWQLKTAPEKLFGTPVAIDRVDSLTGLVADVEGVALYDDGRYRYLVVSSQGNDSYAVYDAAAPFIFRGRFRVGAGAVIDGAQETDGLEANATPMGDVFPAGILVVQDGFNGPYGSPQNFKIIDWRDIAKALDLPR